MSKPLVDLYQLRMRYNSRAGGLTIVTHSLKHWMLPDAGFAVPGTVPGSINLTVKDNTTITFEAWTIELSEALAAVFSEPPDTAFGSLEIWAHPATGTNPYFVSAVQAAFPPSNTGTGIPAQATICTARMRSGRISKVYLMETTNPNSNSSAIDAVTPNSPVDFLFELLMDPKSAFCDREGSFMIDPLRQFPGTNEAVFKERFR